MEKQFSDAKGRDWKLSMTYGDVKRVRNALDVNLLGLGDKRVSEADLQNMSPDELPIMMRLQVDELLLIDTIFVLIEPQAKEQGVSDEEFGSSLTPECALKAKDAFWEVWQDFFQRSGKESEAKTMKAYCNACKKLSEADESLDRILEQATEKTLEDKQRMLTS
jgi:hypothetical protein